MDKEKTLRKLKQEIEEVREKFGIDFAEVVRCKDCKHWHEETAWCYHHSHFVKPNGGFCYPWESADWKMLMPNDYCSYGERRDNDESLRIST